MKQATGTRPSRALPYELHVSAREDATNRALRLIFSNTGTAAAVFHVYDRLHLDRVPRRRLLRHRILRHRVPALPCPPPCPLPCTRTLYSW